MFERILNLYSHSTGFRRFFFRVILEILRRLFILFGDPAYRLSLRGRNMILPISHKLPLYIAQYPYYDELPKRVAEYLRKQDGFLAMIDVGANVGDTILACLDTIDDRFLAVEANPEFVWYLKRNCATIPNFLLVEAYCSFDDLGIEKVKIDTANGTARILRGQDGNLDISIRKLDSIINDHLTMSPFNFLKIDTDGWDFKVITGASDFIRRNRPALLMECDFFDNPNYMNDFSKTMELLLMADYETVIAYDNFGYLFGVFPLKEYLNFRDALFHQLVSQFGYYDLLILDKSHCSFVQLEKTYFAESIPNINRKRAAKEVIGI